MTSQRTRVRTMCTRRSYVRAIIIIIKIIVKYYKTTTTIIIIYYKFAKLFLFCLLYVRFANSVFFARCFFFFLQKGSGSPRFVSCVSRRKEPKANLISFLFYIGFFSAVCIHSYRERKIENIILSKELKIFKGSLLKIGT